jgi:hypothetical protein
MSVVYQPVSTHIAGMIMKVKELVDVQEVDRALTKGEVKAARRPDPGFWVESRAQMDISSSTIAHEEHN